ncbi:MAG: Protein translocase subunit SecE [Calditrichaeota bacterium]|nr:Protein translocase subunit SecE [Calditrichota bacterium]
MLKKAVNYVQNVRNEMSKVTWPTRPVLIESTGITLLLSVILAIFIFTADYIISRFINLII